MPRLVIANIDYLVTVDPTRRITGPQQAVASIWPMH